jgi:inward rectifier potassium channel
MAMRLSNIKNWRTGTKEENDLGFGIKLTSKENRLVNKDGSFNVVRKGHRIWTPYQTLVEISWGLFFVLLTLFFLIITMIFGLMFYLVGTDSFNGIRPGPAWDVYLQFFFLSVQTFTTVGYGSMSPQGILASSLTSAEAFSGSIIIAMATGIMFARFARPKAKILFSSKALISPLEGGYAFLFRIANLRNNRIINLEAKVTMAWLEEVNGSYARRFANLPLERDKVNLFPLSWTIVHPIDENSPLYGKTKEELHGMQPEFIILINGYDETFAQNVHTNSSYTKSDLIIPGKFQPMFYQEEDSGKSILELDKIDNYIELETPFFEIK